MRVSTILVAAFAGSVIAAPYAEPILASRDLIARQDATPAAKVKKPFSWKAFGWGGLAVFGAQMLGLFRRDLDAIAGKDEWTWEDLGEVLADQAVKTLNESANANEAAICVDVPYTVQNDSLARKLGGFNVEGGGENATYDCFLLAGPNRFTIDLELGTPTPDSVAVIAGPGQWNETTGVLVL